MSDQISKDNNKSDNSNMINMQTDYTRFHVADSGTDSCIYGIKNVTEGRSIDNISRTSVSTAAQESSAVAASALSLLSTTSSLMNPEWSVDIDSKGSSSSSNIGPNDVLLGRGGGTNHHVGNRLFRELVKDYQPKYLLAKKLDKANVAKQIVSLIVNRGGRFLTQRPDGVWQEVSAQRAREKTSQALRENLIVRSSTSLSQQQQQPTKVEKQQQPSQHPTPAVLQQNQQLQQHHLNIATVSSPSSSSSYSSACSAESNEQEKLQIEIPNSTSVSSSSTTTPAWSHHQEQHQQEQQRKRRVYTIKKSFVTGTVVKPSLETGSNNGTEPNASLYQSLPLSQQEIRKQKLLQSKNKRQKQEKVEENIQVLPLPSLTSSATLLQPSNNTTQTSPSIVSLPSSLNVLKYNYVRTNGLQNTSNSNSNSNINCYSQGIVPSSPCSLQFINKDNNRLMTNNQDIDDNDDDDEIDTALAMVCMATNRI